MSIGQNIKSLREQHNLSQLELGRIVGVTDKAVSTWENNLKIPRKGTMQKIADYFAIQKTDIIEDNQTQIKRPFAAYSKEDENFSKEEIKQVNSFIEFVKKQRSNE